MFKYKITNYRAEGMWSEAWLSFINTGDNCCTPYEKNAMTYLEEDCAEIERLLRKWKYRFEKVDISKGGKK